MDGRRDWTYDAYGPYTGLNATVGDLHSHGQRYIMIVVSDGYGHSPDDFDHHYAKASPVNISVFTVIVVCHLSRWSVGCSIVC